MGLPQLPTAIYVIGYLLGTKACDHSRPAAQNTFRNTSLNRPDEKANRSGEKITPGCRPGLLTSPECNPSSARCYDAAGSRRSRRRC
jgi:hypothetical protein